MPRLYDLKRGAKIYTGDVITRAGKRIKDAVAVYEHRDGMYSYSNLQDKNGVQVMNGKHPAVIHLSVSTPLVAFKDGYKIAGESEETT